MRHLLRSLEKRLVVERTEITVIPLVRDLLSRWEDAISGNRPAPDVLDFVVRLIRSGYCLATGSRAFTYLDECRRKGSLPGEGRLLQILMPWYVPDNPSALSPLSHPTSPRSSPKRRARRIPWARVRQAWRLVRRVFRTGQAGKVGALGSSRKWESRRPRASQKKKASALVRALASRIFPALKPRLEDVEHGLDRHPQLQLATTDGCALERWGRLRNREAPCIEAPGLRNRAAALADEHQPPQRHRR